MLLCMQATLIGECGEGREAWPTIVSLRKLLAILLLAVLGLPFTSTLLALTPKGEANLPACCRRAGEHHCIFPSSQSHAISNKPMFAAPPETCPFAATLMAPNHHPPASGAPGRQIASPAYQGQVARIARTEAMRRISLDRSRQKRGPPLPSPSRSV